MPTTKPRAARPSFEAADLFDRLDSAMRLWPRRKLEPTQLVEKALDDLHEVWAAVRMDHGDDLEVPPTRTSTARPVTRRPRSDDRARTRPGRSRKAENDKVREAFIVKRYAVHVRRLRNEKAAREAVAEEVRTGRYLHSWERKEIEFWGGRFPYETYSEGSVLRVLKKYQAS